jgi:DNA-binding IclR family transcriptional regulator
MTARDVRALEARLLEVLSASPGLTRTEIATRLGVEPPHVHRPVVNLLHAGHIVREGHKERTRYRPSRGRDIVAP